MSQVSDNISLHITKVTQINADTYTKVSPYLKKQFEYNNWKGIPAESRAVWATIYDGQVYLSFLRVCILIWNPANFIIGVMWDRLEIWILCSTFMIGTKYNCDMGLCTKSDLSICHNMCNTDNSMLTLVMNYYIWQVETPHNNDKLGVC